MKRRNLLIGAAGVTVLGATAWANRNEMLRAAIISNTNDSLNTSPAISIDSDLCLMTTEQTAGPFHVASPMRRDVREDRVGIEFDLKLQLVDVEHCSPLAETVVEIWHCDAAGRYSAYPENISRSPVETFALLEDADETGHVPRTSDSAYLRGSQLVDAQGVVEFKTILPGWYDPRVPHIHVMAHVGGERGLTTQLYFPMDYMNEVYRTHPMYRDFDECTYGLVTDPVLADHSDVPGSILQLTERGAGLVASVRLGVA